MTVKDFNIEDSVYTETNFTVIGTVEEIEGDLAHVRWHTDTRPIPTAIERLKKSSYRQEQVNKMMDVAPEVFRFMEQVEDALNDKCQLSIWEKAVKLQVEKFMDYIKPKEDGSETE